jgi:hypothetical protein
MPLERSRSVIDRVLNLTIGSAAPRPWLAAARLAPDQVRRYWPKAVWRRSWKPIDS